MDMRIKTKTLGNKAVIILSGEVVGFDSIKLSKVFRSYQARLYEEIIIDLRKVTFMDSNCLGALIYTQFLLEKYKKRIVLAAKTEYVKELFRDCAFDKVFEIVETYEC